MKCPKCGNLDTKVIETRVIENNQVIRRRRECERCEFRFTTFERRSTVELTVVKKDGTKEFYDRSKIKKALLLAFAKREVSLDQIDELISNLEIERSKDRDEIASKTIGADIVKALKNIDFIAYVRFASVYLNFENREDFKDLLS